MANSKPTDHPVDRPGDFLSNAELESWFCVDTALHDEAASALIQLKDWCQRMRIQGVRERIILHAISTVAVESIRHLNRDDGVAFIEDWRAQLNQ